MQVAKTQGSKSKVVSIFAVAAVLAMATVLSICLPTLAYAGNMAVIDVSQLANTDKSEVFGDSLWSYDGSTKWLELTEPSGEYTLTGINNDINVHITSTAIGAQVTLKDLDITAHVSSPSFDPFLVEATCTVTLEGSNKITSPTGGGFSLNKSGITCTINGNDSLELISKTAGNTIGVSYGSVLRITEYASVTAEGTVVISGSGEYRIGDNASLTVHNSDNYPFSNTFVVDDPGSNYLWKLTDVDLESGYTVGHSTIEVRFEKGKAGTIAREAPALPSSDASLISVAGQTITAGSEAGTKSAFKTASITVPNSKTSITDADLLAATGATAGLYNSSFSGSSSPVALNVGENHVYIRVSAADGITELYYDITVIREDLIGGASTTNVGGSATRLPATGDLGSVLLGILILVAILGGAGALVLHRKQRKKDIQ